MENFEEDLFNKILLSLTLENLRINYHSKTLEAECTLTEPIYGTKYNFEKFSEEIV